MTAERELSKYRFSLVGKGKIIWDKGDLELADDYVFSRVGKLRKATISFVM
jgi:hypothetical protein